jgi:hypothetical protein
MQSRLRSKSEFQLLHLNLICIYKSGDNFKKSSLLFTHHYKNYHSLRLFTLELWPI